MTARAPHFEVVHADAGWHARFVAANGQTVWTTESYTRRKTAVRAVDLIVGEGYGPRPDGAVGWQGNPGWTAVREVDERSKP